jgi:cell wall-associated NlpC family hydrolase
MKRALAFCLAFVPMSLFSVAPAWAAGQPAPGQIVSGASGRCMDADGPGGKGHNGSVVQLWDCNTNVWQKWTYTGDGHIKSRYDNRCLDADGGGTRDQNGAVIQMWDCNGNAWQKWTVGSDGKIRSQYNSRCLDSDRNGMHTQQGALLQLWDCNANSWQSWPNGLARLDAGQSLGSGEALVDGGYMVVMQGDGNLVEYGPSGPLWATYTGSGSSRLANQTDGNLVVLPDSGGVAWASGTGGGSGTLVLQDDGNVALYGSGGPTWTTYTAGGTSKMAVTGAVAIAKRQLGKPYSYGATGPNSFDCSGLTQAAYASAGVAIPRTSQDQYTHSTRVSLAALQPGDLVFYYGSSPSHVAMYVGNGQIIEALKTGTNVRYDSINYPGTPMGYGRVS